jgi:hypothetical protein
MDKKYYEDNSGIIDDAKYQCQNSDCQEIMFGYQLLPIVYEVLKDDPSHPYGVSGTGKFKCSIRRCCYCRGDVKKIL